MFTKAVYQSLQEIYDPLILYIAEQFAETRPRIESTFAAIQAESDTSPDALKSKARRDLGLKDKLTNIEIATTSEILESAHANLVSTFLSGYPIFSAVSTKDNESVSAQLTALTANDQIRFNWVSELSQSLEDVLSKPFCAVEISWKTVTENNAVIASSKEIADGTFTTAKPTQYSGNAITRLDPYNTYADRSVDPHKVHRDGVYAGYIKKLNYIQMKSFMFDLDDTFTFKDNVARIFSSHNSSTLYKKLATPKAKDSSVTSPIMPLNQFFSKVPTEDKNKPNTTGYEVIIHYQRIIPADVGISKQTLDNSGVSRVFHMVFVNGMLIYAKPIVSGHNFLPIIFGQSKPGEVSKKNMVEYTAPIQDLSTGLITASLQSMRKSVAGGDIIYNPKYIDSETFNNNSAVGRNIPLKNPGLMNDVPIERLYHQVQYRDNITPQFTSFLGVIKTLNEQVVGVNQTTQGNLTKGNRTLHEFDTVTSNSQSRLNLIALSLESNFFTPIKEIVKLNNFLYATKEMIKVPNTETSVQINPEELIESAPNYKLTDGLLPSTKVKNTDAALLALQLMSQNPAMLAEYDIGAIAVSIIMQSGFNDLKDYKRTEDDRQQYLADAAAAGSTETP